jgi:hypothetical protein
MVTSANEPKNDDEALKITGIKMTPAPEVIYRHYEGGLDDNMKLVIRFPSDRIADFWSGGPWKEENATVSSGDGSRGETPWISGHGDTTWIKWKSSTKGRAVEATLPNGEAARVYISEDAEEGFIHAYVFWHET